MSTDEQGLSSEGWPFCTASEASVILSGLVLSLEVFLL